MLKLIQEDNKLKTKTMKPIKIKYKIQVTEKPTYNQWVKHLKDYQVEVGNLKIYKLNG